MICGKLSTVSETNKQKLLKYVTRNDLTSVEKLIKRNENLLSVEYSQPYEHHNIFFIACNDIHETDKVTGETITKLIELGAKCTERTKNDNWEAIHYAAINGNNDKLSAIIKHLTLEEANSLVHCSRHIPRKFHFARHRNVAQSYSNNALNILLKYAPRTPQFRVCCQILIQKGVSVNQPDSNGVTPLGLLKREEHLRDLVELAKSQRGFTSKPAFELIQTGQLDEFISRDFTAEEVNDVDGPSEELSSCTLLQMCCKKSLKSCVKHILDRGGDPNKTIPKNPNTPLMTAIHEDCEEIVHLLLDNKQLVLPVDILIKMQIKYKRLKNAIKVDKYMTMLLEHVETYHRDKRRKYLLASDELNRTALHYAVQYRCSENILKLLQMGAPITKKDTFGYSPLHSITPRVLEKFLDNCISIPKDNEDMENMLFALRNSKEKFSLELDYEALTSENTDGNVHESEFLSQLVKTKKLTYLVSHPVILSYIEVKWSKFKYIVYFNLLLYLIAYVSLLFYGFAFNKYSTISNWLLLAALLITFMREITQIVTFKLNYFKRLENYLDVFLIAGIIYVIAYGWMVILLDPNLKLAYSLVFLLSTLGIFLQLGNLPYFAIKVIILKQTTKTFCKYMIFYIFPVLAFFFCFYMLNEGNSLFFRTLYDVTTMFAGDPQSDYPLRFETNPIFSHIIYVCFIVLIGIILQNLLIGLAVSDMQEIRTQAEFIDKIERAEYITSMEKIVFSQFVNSSHWLLKSMFKKLVETACVFDRENVLVIEPYNNGCVYPKEDPQSKQYIKDQSIIHVLQTILKDLTMDGDAETPYSLKAINERLERIENMLGKLNLDAKC